MIFVLVAGAAAGCFWRSYPDRVRMHSELLVAFARKGHDLVATDRFAAENLPELTYPLERAAAFAADARRRSDTPPPSLAAFDRLIERYRAFVALIDRERHAGGGPAAAASLDEPIAAIEAAADDVTAALARERVSSGGGG